jgi:hypothetical protein
MWRRRDAHIEERRGDFETEERQRRGQRSEVGGRRKADGETLRLDCTTEGAQVGMMKEDERSAVKRGVVLSKGFKQGGKELATDPGSVFKSEIRNRKSEIGSLWLPFI